MYKTHYKFYGKAADILSLSRKMETLQNRRTSFLPNKHGNNWLGNLIKKLGGDPEKVDCDGIWTYFSGRSNSNFTEFKTITENGRCKELERLIHERYPTMEILFLTITDGAYETNDDEHWLFGDMSAKIKYFDDEIEYFSMENIFTILTSHFGKRVENVEEAKRLIDEWNKDRDPKDDKYLGVYFAEIVKE